MILIEVNDMNGDRWVLNPSTISRIKDSTNGHRIVFFVDGTSLDLNAQEGDELIRKVQKL